MEVALSPHIIMLFVLQLAISIMFLWRFDWWKLWFLIKAMNVNQYVIATLRRQREFSSAAVAGVEDVDADVDCDDIMMMTTKWWYGESNAAAVGAAAADDGGRWRLNKHALYKGE